MKLSFHFSATKYSRRGPYRQAHLSMKNRKASQKLLMKNQVGYLMNFFADFFTFKTKMFTFSLGNENSLSASNQVHKTSHESVSKAHSEREAKILTQKKIRKQQLEAFAKPESKTGDPQLILVNKSRFILSSC